MQAALDRSKNDSTGYDSREQIHEFPCVKLHTQAKTYKKYLYFKNFIRNQHLSSALLYTLLSEQEGKGWKGGREEKQEAGGKVKRG